MKTYKNIIFSLSILFLIGCKTGISSETDEHEHAHEEESNEELVALLPKQMEVMDIQLGKFQELNLSTTVKSNGQLELPPQNKASLSALFGGRVKNVLVIQGQAVRKGQVLALLENPKFIEIQKEYINAKNQTDFFQKEYLRKKDLIKENITSVKSFQKAETDYFQSKGLLQAAKAQMELIGLNTSSVEKGVVSAIPITSPLEGFVRLVEVNIGKYVEPRDEMFEIVDNEHIHIDLMVYEKDIHKVKDGQKVIFSLSSIPEKVFNAKVFAVGKSFENDPRALKVHAEITDKNAELLPGMYVDARIVTNDKKVMAVPDDAIVTESGLSYIFVLSERSDHKGTHQHDSEDHHTHEEEKLIFKKIEINTGAADIGFTEIVPAQEIPADPVIVVKGAYYLLAEMGKNERGHSH
ncbi:efflux RND transporter periplasmic adaptor subunit [Reichenbachiella sp. MALMAid0571]|uniref:efflux RND transporter periplasmic adaptor subunit n=1 Tax=Reichenbachiella sp. MALMAid0571 TaxID=3143939 RepID=UPI0032DEC98E